MIVISQNQMKQLDETCMKMLQMSSEMLMETAGKACADRIKSIYEANFLHKPIYVICGHGNNGGDGFVIARWLKHYGFTPQILLIGNPKKFTTETLINYNRCQTLNISISPVTNIDHIDSVDFSHSLCIDAVFGNGFNGNLPELHKSLFKKINLNATYKIAIDIPSGLSAETGSVDCDCIQANKTLCIAFLKYGHLIHQGKQYCGMIELMDIGIPKDLLYNDFQRVNLITKDKIEYPTRFKISHKGNYGRIAIIAGSEDYSGAAILASLAALKAGGGLIYLYSSSKMKGHYDSSLIEVIKRTIPESDLLPDQEILFEQLMEMDSILIGPGIGISEYSTKLTETVIKLSEFKPVIMDADALNIIAKNKELLSNCTGKNILFTPHIAEFSRLCQKDINQVLNNQIQELEEFTNQYEIPLILKSSVSICSYKKQLIIIDKGNDGLSTGGSGDVLAGIITSFTAQHICSKRESHDLKQILCQSAISASFLMGETAEQINQIYDTPAICPQDIIQNLFKKQS